ncbi:MAG TPA: methylated-DNA--[protein]-cysteine S-methyltransferase [Pirellulales bacterium]|nr:methylated-DNA--[protein]-cysteine S-methyltransferase [Pirellulales bacterium]
MKTDDRFRYSIDCPSPVGVWTILSDGAAVVGVYLAGQRHLPIIPRDLPTNAVCKKAARQITEYFAGKRSEFDLPLAPAGTEFEERVWNALREIPYGTTWSYGQLARHIGAPKAARAVGAANGQNPIAVIIPCHRVIGSNGKHVGYAGGLNVKAWLLEHEAPFARPTKRRGERLLPL